MNKIKGLYKVNTIKVHKKKLRYLNLVLRKSN